MLLELSRLHRHIWYAYASWTFASSRKRNETRQPRHDSLGNGGRWGWLWDRRRALCTYHATEPRPDLHRDGQPDLWAHHRTDLSYQSHRHEDQEHAVWEC